MRIKLKVKNPKRREDKTEQDTQDVYEYLADYSKTIYENEIRISNSLIQQSSQMQTAFSFVIAAVFMVASLVFDKVEYLSNTFLVACFSTITAALLFCLLFATIAQSNRKKTDYPDVSEIHKYIYDNYESFKTPSQRSKYTVETIEEMQASFKRINEKRRTWIERSMHSFYVALGLCVFWFFAALLKLI